MTARASLVEERLLREWRYETRGPYPGAAYNIYDLDREDIVAEHNATVKALRAALAEAALQEERALGHWTNWVAARNGLTAARAALQRYGRHRRPCAYLDTAVDNMDDSMCNCGFRDVRDCGEGKME